MIRFLAKLFGVAKTPASVCNDAHKALALPPEAASSESDSGAMPAPHQPNVLADADDAVHSSAAQCSLAICAIMKDEALNVLEWIAYHKVIGVERFYLYDNGSSDNVRDLLDPLILNGTVILKEWLIVPGQMRAYDDFAAHHRHSARWAAFIDLDEYINVLSDEPLIDWLNRFGDVGGVALHWLMFGSSGFDEPPEDIQIASYVHRLPLDAAENQHVKTIVRMESFKEAWDPHCFVTYNPVVNENGEQLHGRYSVQEIQPHTYACINHYFTRSRRDWIAKIKRGRADTDLIEEMRPDNWFDHYAALATIPDHSICRYADATREELARLKSLNS